MWHHAAFPMVELARSRLASQHADQELEVAVANFRQMLIAGFAAKKVSISGELKTIQLRLVANAGKGEFYLTWSPSRKRNPRIFIRECPNVQQSERNAMLTWLNVFAQTTLSRWWQSRRRATRSRRGSPTR